MNLFRKFHDVAVADAAGGGSEAAVAEEKVAPPPTQSIAELMAKSGIKRSGDDQPQNTQAAKPIVNKVEKKEEPKAEEKVEKVETTTTTSNDAKAKSESQSPILETEETAKPPIAETEKPAVQTWQEVLKSQQPELVLKELGFDDKKVNFLKKELDPRMLAFLEVWENKGDVQGYLKELTTDYTKMSPEEVMRHQLREDYPKASEAALNALFKKKVVEAYNLDSEDADLAEEGKMLLEAEADRHRDKFVAKQQEKLLPPPPEAKQPEPDLQAEKAKKDFEAYVATINTDPYSQKVFDKKQITIGKGDDKFTFPVDPEAIKNVLFDSEKWAETQFERVNNTDGSFKYAPKVQNQILTAAVAVYGDKFLDAYAQHYKSLGGKSAIEPIVNAKPPENASGTQSEGAPTSAASAMAKSGRLNSGGE